MELRTSGPRIGNQQRKPSRNPSSSEGRGSQRLEGNPMPCPGVDWLNSQNLFQYSPLEHTQRHVSIPQPSPESLTLCDPSPTNAQYLLTPVPSDISHVLENKGTSNEAKKQIIPQDFFALIIPVDKVLEHGERLFEEADQPPLALARNAHKPRRDTSQIYYDLEIIGRDEKACADLYVAFGFTRGHPHHDFSSAVCKAFILRRFKSRSSMNPTTEKVHRYSVPDFKLNVGKFSRCKAAGILTSSFEQKVRAAYWRGFQQDFLRGSLGNHRIAANVAIHSSTAGPSNSGPTPAVVDVQYGNSRGQFPEPPPTVPQPHRHPSLQEAAPTVPYLLSPLLAPPNEMEIPHWTGQDNWGTVFGSSTFPIQGKNTTMPAPPTTTSEPPYVDGISSRNFLGSGLYTPGHGPIPMVNYQVTNRSADYDLTYRHVSVAHAQFGNYNRLVAGPSFNYPPADLVQTDISRAAVSDIYALGQGPIQKELLGLAGFTPLPSHHSASSSRSYVPTTALTVPVIPKRRRPGRPRKLELDQPLEPPPNTYPRISPEETQLMAPVYPIHNNVATAGAGLTHELAPGMSSPHTIAYGQTYNPPQGSLPYMSGFHYPPGLPSQPLGLTSGGQVAPLNFNSEIPAAQHPTQQTNLEDLLQADDIGPIWWV